MQAVDLKGIMDEYFSDENRKIDNDKLHNICRYHKKEKTCKYISLIPNGFICVKNTPLKNILDGRAKNNLMVAKGDNCKGLGTKK